MFQKGDIIEGSNSNGDALRHELVYLGGEVEGDFIGVILTASSAEAEAVPLPNEYLVKIDEQGQEYPFHYHNTHFIHLRILKKPQWGPYYKIGQLTPDGIAFIDREIQTAPTMEWLEYLQFKGL